MARKLIDQEEAARILGITEEEISSLRDRKKLFPYRDGDLWKYKLEDLERLRSDMEAEKAEQASQGTGDEASWTAESNLGDVELELNDDLDSILLSEIELGKSSKEGASTIIGKMPDEAAADSDLASAADAKTAPAAATDSGITLAGDSGVTLGGDAMTSDLKLVSSDVLLAAAAPEVSKKPAGGSSNKMFGSDALKLSDDELSLIDAGSAVKEPAKPADGSKKGSGSSIKLGDEELEVVLGGSKPGSDVTQSPSDSGIQLISASDSGLSLDQPLALGSSARRLLEMGDEAVVGAESAAQPAQELKADDDFLLTAMDETGEESSDSGSQVIALDTDDELSSGMFAPVAGGEGLLEEERGAAPLSAAPRVMAAPTMAAAPALMAASAPAEAHFSTANVMILTVCVVLLLLCGMMTYDLMRNMWSWDGPYSVNSSILESLGGSIGWFEK